MMKRFLVLLLAVVFVAGCVSPPSTGTIDPSKRLVVVSAFPPVFIGEKVGFTTILGDSLGAQLAGPINPTLLHSIGGVLSKMGASTWFAKESGLDINNTIVDLVRENLNREGTVVDGRSVGLVGDLPLFGIPLSVSERALQKGEIDRLANDYNADVVVVIHSALVRDWIQESSRSIYGIGHFDSHFQGAYCVLAASVYDPRSGVLGAPHIVKHARVPNGIEWHKTWSEYPPAEQRVLSRALDVVLKESLPILLDDLGLARKPVKPLPIAHNFAGHEIPKSFIPDSNEFDVPEWASMKQARDAVIAAFKEYGWSATVNAEERIVGVYRKGTKEAVCTVTFPARKIVMNPEGFRVQSDGNRVSCEYYKGWNENLKEFITGALMKADVEMPK